MFLKLIINLHKSISKHITREILRICTKYFASEKGEIERGMFGNFLHKYTLAVELSGNLIEMQLFIF